MSSAAKNWFLAFRPKTLTAAVVPVAVGTGLARHTDGLVDWYIVVSALGVALFIQVATNLFNDALDFKKGSDTEDRIGPTRVTQAGLISPRLVFIGAIACLAIAVLFGIPLVLKGGLVIAVLGAISLFLAYGYTGGFFPLAYLGLGDLFVMIFFGLVAVSATHYLHTGSFDPLAIVAGIQVGATATLILAVNNLRDIKQDKKADKKTLPVRFGIRFGRVEILGLALIFLIMSILWIKEDNFFAAILPIVCSLPFLVAVVLGVMKSEPGPVYNRYLAFASLAHLVGGAMLTTGLWIG